MHVDRFQLDYLPEIYQLSVVHLKIIWGAISYKLQRLSIDYLLQSYFISSTSQHKSFAELLDGSRYKLQDPLFAMLIIVLLNGATDINYVQY